ncbi:Uncharacterised protein [Vibrio cholerae]|nr:Uncharacterised protein [Vibrio cholerae]
MPRIPNLGGVPALWSIFSLPIVSLPAYSSATSSRIGAIILQGPHHSAQKSTRTGPAALITSFSKPSSVSCKILSLIFHSNVIFCTGDNSTSK